MPVFRERKREARDEEEREVIETRRKRVRKGKREKTEKSFRNRMEWRGLERCAKLCACMQSWRKSDQCV